MAMPEVAKLFGDEPFWPSIELIPVLVLGYYFVFLYSFPVNFEFYHQRTRTIAIGTCLTAGTNIALNYVLIPLWGMTGAAVATLLSYAALWLFHLILARVSIKSEYHFKEKRFYLYLLFTVMGTALFYVIEDMWYIRWFLFLVLAAAVLYRLKKQRSIF